jgi:hypothetical protein
VETMQPVVLRGLTGLALPVEEFERRADAVRHELVRQDLGALVVHGSARHYAPLAWVTGFIPMTRFAIAVVPAEGGVELFLATPGTRDLPAMRRLAAVSAVAPINGLAGCVGRFHRVAVAGARYMRAPQELAIRGCAEVAGDGDALLARVAAEPSPGELRLLDAAADGAAWAAARVEEAWREGAGSRPALLAGDLLARERGAHDVRVLWSPDGGRTLRPLAGSVAVRPDPFAFYLALEIGGYWGEAFRTPGAPAGEPEAPHPIVAPAARMWLSIEEMADEPRRPGVYSLRTATASGALTSRTVHVR